MTLDNQFQAKIRSIAEGECIEIMKDAQEYNNRLRRPYKMHFVAKVIRIDNVEDGQGAEVLIFAKRFPTINNSFYFFSGESFISK